VSEREDRGHGFEAARRRHRVADHRLDGADEHASLAEHLAQRRSLHAIVLDRARPVRVDVADVAGRGAGPGEGREHRPHHPIAGRLGRRHVIRIRRHPVAGQLGPDPRSACPRGVRVLEHDERGAFADGHATTLAVERPARPGVEQLERVEAQEADAGEGVHTARHRGGDDAVGDQVGGQRQRHGSRAACGHDGLAGAVEPEPAAQHRRMGGRQHRPYGRSTGDAVSTLPAPVRPLGLQHAATHRAHHEGGAGALGTTETGVLERLSCCDQCESIATGPAGRTRHHVRHLGTDPATKALGLDQCERSNGARPRAESGPERLDAHSERAHRAHASDDDSTHARAARSAGMCFDLMSSRPPLLARARVGSI
jgi:hypothetical protein